MGMLDRLLGRNDRGPDLAPLWHQVVAIARAPHWYSTGGVADTIDGRFDCITMVLSLVLIRMEREDTLRHATARLTERFVADMDGQLRQNGIGDLVMGKRMGRLMEALGGRLDAYRAALAEPDDRALIAAINRNLTLTDRADPAAIAAALRELQSTLAATGTADLLDGTIAQ